MQPDIELLKSAAKAAGIDAEWLPGCGDALHLTSPGATEIYWNPLRDDGQAFRLANATLLTVYHSENAVIVRPRQYSLEWVSERLDDSSGDRNAAARRAIVRAVAAMAGCSGGGAK